jgi:hypothetical protein
MVRPAARRALVHWAREAYLVSERRACRAVGVERSMVRYRSRGPSQQPLRTRLRELATVRLRAGYQQLHEAVCAPARSSVAWPCPSGTRGPGASVNGLL